MLGAGLHAQPALNHDGGQRILPVARQATYGVHFAASFVSIHRPGRSRAQGCHNHEGNVAKPTGHEGPRAACGVRLSRTRNPNDRAWSPVRRGEGGYLKGLLGASRSRRVSYDFRHGARASIWHEIAARSHLVVAAIGTVVFLGMAGTAIWLALPSDKAPVVARKSEAAPVAASTANASVVATAPAKAPEPSLDAVQNAEELRAQSTGTEIAKVDPLDDFEPLPQGDPRWIAPDGKDVKAAARAAAALATQDSTDGITASAFAGDDDAGMADGAATAAIPAARPPNQDDETVRSASAARAGRTLRAVTMRARPSSRGSVLGTVPGRVAVEVISCKSWCEIIYNGKQGFVYKSFLQNGGR